MKIQFNLKEVESNTLMLCASFPNNKFKNVSSSYLKVFEINKDDLINYLSNKYFPFNIEKYDKRENKSFLYAKSMDYLGYFGFIDNDNKSIYIDLNIWKINIDKKSKEDIINEVKIIKAEFLKFIQMLDDLINLINKQEICLTEINNLINVTDKNFTGKINKSKERLDNLYNSFKYLKIPNYGLTVKETYPQLIGNGVYLLSSVYVDYMRDYHKDAVLDGYYQSKKIDEKLLNLNCKYYEVESEFDSNGMMKIFDYDDFINFIDIDDYYVTG